MKREQYRQGDVFLERVSSPPANVGDEIKPKEDRVILAEGEATGHHHSVPSSAARMFAVAGGMMLLKVVQETILSHQEHAPITLPPGDYLVRRQQEWSPIGWRTVLD